MYLVVCLRDGATISKALDYSTASMLLENFVKASDGFYTKDDFVIMNWRDINA